MRYAVDASRYSAKALREEAATVLGLISHCGNLHDVRRELYSAVSRFQYFSTGSEEGDSRHIIVRDCARALRGMISERSESMAGFSVAEALFDVARGRNRPDLTPAFFAELIHLFRGLKGRTEVQWFDTELPGDELSAADSVAQRSIELDRLWEEVESRMSRCPDGLDSQSVARRSERKRRVLSVLGGEESNWEDWQWQVRKIIREPETLSRLIDLSSADYESIVRAREIRLPFGITPYYVSLMDESPDSGHDRAIRAQVLPPPDYVSEMEAHRHDKSYSFDFMRECDTSPIGLVTRRYPAIVILKPFNTCPQICVYCQRNWEIEDAMSPGALASRDDIEAACRWIESHSAIREVLITGGDPLALGDSKLEWVIGRVARIKSVDLIRIGSRIPVTMPMRITRRLASMLGSFRKPGCREVCVVTHVQHPYEVTPDLVEAVDRLRRQGIAVYNQLVYTFHVSRRFEAAHLRLVLRRAGIDPYYTFVPKGKEETRAYRVPIARVMQEQKEETRLLPGMRRTDEVVYNLPGLGKNYMRAVQHRDVISVSANGARVYEFHPWEKNLVRRDSYVGEDIPILDYLSRLSEIGEDPSDYESIWYYF